MSDPVEVAHLAAQNCAATWGEAVRPQVIDAAILAFLKACESEAGVEKLARIVCEGLMESGRTDWGGPVPAPDYYKTARAVLHALADIAGGGT